MNSVLQVKGLSIGNDSRKTTTIVEGEADEAIRKL